MEVDNLDRKMIGESLVNQDGDPGSSPARIAIEGDSIGGHAGQDAGTVHSLVLIELGLLKAQHIGPGEEGLDISGYP